jgi:outer membrane protein TolC
VLEEALATVKSFFEFTTNRFDEGLVQESDLLNVEVQVLDMESQLHEAKSNVQNASDYLSVLMNQSTGTIYTVSEISESSTDGEMTLVVPGSRTDFKALQKAIDATQLMQQSLKMKYLPRLNAFGSYQLNDKKFAAFNADSYLAGIQLTWNLFDGNNIKRQINTLQSEKDKLNVQLNSMQQENQMLLEKSYRDLSNALFKIKQQKAAVSQADESLRILQNRYEEGLVNTTDILNAQTQLSKQKLQLAQAIFSSNTTRAQILFLTTTSSQSK